MHPLADPSDEAIELAGGHPLAVLLVEPVMILEHALSRAAHYIGLTLAGTEVMRGLPHCHGHR